MDDSRDAPLGRSTPAQRIDDATAALELLQAPVDARRHDAENGDGGKQPGGIDALALRGQDHAQSLAAHGHLPDDRTGHRQGETGAQPGQDGGQSQRQLHIRHHGRAVGAVQPSSIT